MMVADVKIMPVQMVTRENRATVPAAGAALDRLLAEAGDPDAMRAARVQGLRAEVAAGRYRVDPAALACSILRELLADHLR